VARPLLAVPNLSEGRDTGRIAALQRAFSQSVELLDRHVDADHNRTVFTLAGGTDALVGALVEGASEAARQIDMNAHEGVHPAIGALDVCPLVWLDEGSRGAGPPRARARPPGPGARGPPR
jgi:glutamate formiminotransferase